MILNSFQLTGFQFENVSLRSNINTVGKKNLVAFLLIKKESH